MDKMKQWVALAALGALMIAVGGWFLVISPKRADAAALKAEAASRQQDNQVLSTKLAQLKAQAKALPAQQAKLAAVAAKIPNNTAMPALVRALTDAADDTGVELVSMTPGVPVAQAATAPVTTTAAGSTPAAGTTAASARSAAAAASVGSLQSIPVGVNVVGSYFQVAEYLDRLENLTRAFRVTGFNLNPGTNPVKNPASQPKVDTGKMLTAVINGLVFDTTGSTTASLTAAK